ncbi:MAG: family oxidoreductase [Thermoleophilia bacterium]|nr:family oxidoreductase [Thermoleophilia bacterium]
MEEGSFIAGEATWYRARMDLGISGRIALVTGASTGIALGIAQQLAGEGVRVAIASRSRSRIDAAAAATPGLTGFVHDTSDLTAAPALVTAVEEQLGPIDILVASTGGPPAGADPLAFTAEQWRAAYEQLVLGSVALIEAVLPGMRERGWGRIVSISSTSIREPLDQLVLSTAHRTGLAASLKTFARHVAADGVTINSILPGRIATDRLVENYGSIESAAERARSEVPAGRLGSVAEVAAAATFLCSDTASYVTGVQLAVDGGLIRGL